MEAPEWAFHRRLAGNLFKVKLNGSWSSIVLFVLLLMIRSATTRPYYVHTPSGYAQFEYPTTMTAVELGLISMPMMGGGMFPGQFGGVGLSNGYRGSLPVQTPYSGDALARQSWPPTSRTYPNSAFGNNAQFYGGSEGMMGGFGGGRPMHAGGYGGQMGGGYGFSPRY